MDIAPERFHRHMRLLRRLRFHPLTTDDLLRFHQDHSQTLPRRSYLPTFDDGYQDNFIPLGRQAKNRPLLFVPGAELGRTAYWADGEPLLDVDGLRRLQEVGVTIGSHGQHHQRLATLSEMEIHEEVTQSRRTLTDILSGAPIEAIAYPYGSHNMETLGATARAGYRLGFTTEPGRNGAGSHPLCLRRIGVWSNDGTRSFLWKVLTAEYVPGASPGAAPPDVGSDRMRKTAARLQQLLRHRIRPARLGRRGAATRL